MKKYNEQKNKDQENGERLVDNEEKENLAHLHSIQLTCLLNLSAVELKSQRYKRCVEICDEVCCVCFIFQVS